MSDESRSVYPRRHLPERSNSKDLRWPSPTPLPLFPSEDVNRVLRQILARLDAIEKRLEKIEKALTQQHAP